MYLMKEQDKTPEKQLNEMDRQSSRKRIQNNDSEDDPGPRKKQQDKQTLCEKIMGCTWLFTNDKR